MQIVKANTFIELTTELMAVQNKRNNIFSADDGEIVVIMPLSVLGQILGEATIQEDKELDKIFRQLVIDLT